MNLLFLLKNQTTENEKYHCDIVKMIMLVRGSPWATVGLVKLSNGNQDKGIMNWYTKLMIIAPIT